MLETAERLFYAEGVRSVGVDRIIAEADVATVESEIDRLRNDDRAREAVGSAAAARGEVHRSGALPTLIERMAVATSSE